MTADPNAEKKLAKLERWLAKLTDKGKKGRAKRIELKIAALKAGEPFVDPDDEVIEEIFDSYCDHFVEYNKELFVPIRKLFSDSTFMNTDCQGKGWYLLTLATDEVKGVLTFDPPKPIGSFHLYNVLGFWLGVFESLLGLLFFDQGWLSFTWNGGIGYTVAYSLYWMLTCTEVPTLQVAALMFVAAYAALNGLLGVLNFFNLCMAALYFSKAFCDLLLLICGYKIYRTRRVLIDMV